MSIDSTGSAKLTSYSLITTPLLSTPSYTVVIEKEYYKLSRNNRKPIIGCLMMLKNEEARILESLSSCKDHVDCYIIYDTGSTDNTMKIIIDYCEENKKNLYMIQGDFVNFSVSRNVSLDYADTREVHFLLLLDCSDILQGGEKLRKFALEQMNTPPNAFLMCQHWFSGQYDKYFNTRFIRARKGWRYMGSVHEYMADTLEVKGAPVYKMSDDMILYQDRTKDNNKSGPRFQRDKVLLVADHKKDPTEPRVLFYLAQTCSCTNDQDESFYYYKLRTEVEGFQEEKFHAYLRCGEISERLMHTWPDSMAWYMKAVEHSVRAEPLIKIAMHYQFVKNWFLAYSFIAMACSISYPDHCILFVDKHAYDYTRWHILGIVAFYVGKFAEGKQACLKAIEKGLNSDLDKKNLEFYENKEKENLKPITKEQFMKSTVESLHKDNPTIPINKLEKLALGKWKNRKNDTPSPP